MPEFTCCQKQNKTKTFARCWHTDFVMENLKADFNSSFCQKFSRIPMFIPHPLQTLLSSVKKINVVGTLEEVLEALKDYFSKNQLYDKENPHIIHCENDALKDVLGVSQFTLLEMKRQLLKILLLENRNNIKDMLNQVVTVDTAKRKAEDDCDIDKRLCVEAAGTTHEAQNSFCGNKSRGDNDLSDDSSSEFSRTEEKNASLFNSFFAINHMYDIEYEVETSSSTIESVTDSDSEIEDIVKVAAVSHIIKVDSDIDFWADRSSEEFCDNSDVEISESDKWECKTCGSRNKPLTRYCLKCWDERKGWSECQKERRVPPRCRRKYLKNRDNIDVQVDRLIEETSFQDIPCSSSQQSTSAQSSSADNCLSSLGMCIICCVKPKNATVIHGKIGHQFSCYRCARKLFSLKKPCPLCRKAIERVVHQIVG